MATYTQIEDQHRRLKDAEANDAKMQNLQRALDEARTKGTKANEKLEELQRREKEMTAKESEHRQQVPFSQPGGW